MFKKDEQCPECAWVHTRDTDECVGCRTLEEVDKPVAHIHNWHVIVRGRGLSLVGEVSRHPRQDEFKAHLQVTSPIVRLDMTRRVAVTANTIYHLGQIGQN